MATYGYSTPYTGRGDPGPLPPGYMEAATAPGRNLAMGIAAMGQGLGKAIEQYRTKKADTEAATQSWETVSGLMQQQLSSDPKYLAIQQYMETGALPQGVTEQDIPRYTQQVQADREMLNKFSSLGEKFPDMSLAKKKAALGDAVMVLNQYRTDQQKQAETELRNLQTTAARFNLQTAQGAEARRLGLEQAISQVAQLPTTQDVTVPASPAIISSSLNIPAEQQPYTPFYQVQQIPGGTIQQPPAPQMPQGPTFGGMSFGGGQQYTQGLGRNIMLGRLARSLLHLRRFRQPRLPALPPSRSARFRLSSRSRSNARSPRPSPSTTRTVSGRRSTCSSAWVLRSTQTPSGAFWRPLGRLGPSRSTPRPCPAASPWCVRTARWTSCLRPRWSRARI